MKQNRTFTFIMLLLIVLGLSACSSHDEIINGKYISTLDNSLYYEFSHDGKYSTNINDEVWDIQDYSFSGTYEITDNKITLSADSSNNFKIELGYIYNNYIGSLWSGKLPNNDCEQTEILLNLIDSLYLDYNFNNDGTYKYTTTSNNKIVHSEHGTYTVNGNEVICTNKGGITTTFINVEDKVFCVEYVKE